MQEKEAQAQHRQTISVLIVVSLFICGVCVAIICSACCCCRCCCSNCCLTVFCKRFLAIFNCHCLSVWLAVHFVFVGQWLSQFHAIRYIRNPEELKLQPNRRNAHHIERGLQLWLRVQFYHPWSNMNMLISYLMTQVIALLNKRLNNVMGNCKQGWAGPIEQSLRDYEINEKLRLRQRDLMYGKW